jgi:hypothetical protein
MNNSLQLLDKISFPALSLRKGVLSGMLSKHKALKDVADGRLYGEKYSSLLMTLLHDWFPIFGTCVGSQHQAKLVDTIHRLPRYKLASERNIV